jgi:hypothetical protein
MARSGSTNTRKTLHLYGIRGTNLDRLADSPELSVEHIVSEAEDLRRDPKVRDVPAALAARLMEHCGIQRKGAISADVIARIKVIEQLRRNSRLNPNRPKPP